MKNFFESKFNKGKENLKKGMILTGALGASIASEAQVSSDVAYASNETHIETSTKAESNAEKNAYHLGGSEEEVAKETKRIQLENEKKELEVKLKLAEVKYEAQVKEFINALDNAETYLESVKKKDEARTLEETESLPGYIQTLIDEAMQKFPDSDEEKIVEAILSRMYSPEQKSDTKQEKEYKASIIGMQNVLGHNAIGNTMNQTNQDIKGHETLPQEIKKVVAAGVKEAKAKKALEDNAQDLATLG